jgi:spore germination cell wall hydrolase CwlJ-like protein
MRLISDTALAAATIWQEARGEPYQGKLAVAEVIRNRMRFKYSSDGTVAGTVARSYQFSGWNDDPGDNKQLVQSLKLDDDDPVVQECMTAWHDANMNGTNVAKGATLYANLNISKPGWAKASMKVAEIGNHTFFVEH